MAKPDADRRDANEAAESFCGFVIACGNAAGIFRPVEALLDEVAQPVEGAIHGYTQFADIADWDLVRQCTLPWFLRISFLIAAIFQQDARLGLSAMTRLKPRQSKVWPGVISDHRRLCPALMM